MLKINDLICRHKRLHFCAHPLERWWIQGPTGWGKTSFFDCLTGLRPREGGDIWWHEERLTDLPTKKRPISYLLQKYPVFNHLTVKQQGALVPNPKDFQALIAQYLPTIRPEQRGDQLSGGEQRLLGLLRMIVENRPILLLDESFVGLDTVLKLQMQALLKEHQCQHGTLILFTSHDVDDFKSFATHTVKPLEVSAESPSLNPIS